MAPASQPLSFTAEDETLTAQFTATVPATARRTRSTSISCRWTTRSRTIPACYLPSVVIPIEDLVDEEWAEWYRLAPADRWARSQEFWRTFLALLASEPNLDLFRAALADLRAELEGLLPSPPGTMGSNKPQRADLAHVSVIL